MVLAWLEAHWSNTLTLMDVFTHGLVLMMWSMVLCRALPFFASYVETYAHLSSFHAYFDDIIPLLDEFVELLDDLAYG
jgi:hypothetical protein